MTSQINQCHRFIETMGWTCIHEDNWYAFAESKTGMRQVERPVLDLVLGMAHRHEVDVIVCLDLKRIDRKKHRRYQAIQNALDFGAEFRFVCFPETNGKLPEGELAEIQRFLQDLHDEKEAVEINARMTPQREARYEQGLPHGGRYGPAYGYAPGERTVTRLGRPKGLATLVEDPEESAWVKWLYQTVDDEEDFDKISVRDLTRQLIRLGAPTASREGEWFVKQVRMILRNPMYCGRGRTRRWRLDYRWVENKDTGRVFEKPTMHDRLHTEEWKTKTYPYAKGAVPILIDPEQWDRVQAKLNDAAKRKNRGGPRRTDALAHSSLLDGMIFCATCGMKMTRFWHDAKGHPYYHCSRRASQPEHECRGQNVRADKADLHVLNLLAGLLVDPELLLKLADAAEVQANTEVALASAAEAAYQQQLREIEARRTHLEIALKALSAIKDADMSGEIQGVRDKLARLDQDRLDAEQARDNAVPRKVRALQRQELLGAISTHRRWLINFGDEDWQLEDGRILKPYEELEEGPLVVRKHLWASAAAELLGVPEDELPMRVEENYYYEQEPDPNNPDELITTYETIEKTVSRADVIYYLLRAAPRERIRTLMRDLGVVVVVKRPRSRGEWRQHGTTPVSERVFLIAQEALQVGFDEANVCVITSLPSSSIVASSVVKLRGGRK
jgi:hypothetical protein